MIELTVNDMTCDHCVTKISQAVKSVDPDGAFAVDLAAKRVRITSALPAAGFVEALRDAGYTPQVLPS